ncbi:SCO family protein [Pedobacter flavus]|uniref:SCO family protein n=1 Tax=Pedobacter flavus TaxID=3113906 RepID=A0ABU7GZE8_9SPHI|nr:SCO family protein [Pedobacter sp. VNH31]MEE1884153.1 SCO family protein [Pedobacter sp. VNH31]
MKNFSIKKILILVTILALPGFLYYLLEEKGKNRYKTLAYFGPKTPADTFHSKMGKKIRDTIYHEVKLPVLTDQEGKKFDFNSEKDQIFVFNLFYTQAGHPALIANLAVSKFAQSFQRNERVKFLSITLNPEVDTQKRLNLYADSLNVNYGQHKLLTGEKDSIYLAVKNSLLLDVNNTTPISYTNMMVLVDYKHRIRGIYEVANAESLLRLEDEIKVLIAEELRNINDGR